MAGLVPATTADGLPSAHAVERERPLAPTTQTFAGYPATALPFLLNLAANNEKPWFEANRPTYEQSIKLPTEALIVAVSEALRARDLPLEGAPKRSGFRIHRDVRFSRNKSPYKTAIGSVWYRQGSGKDGAGILYFHLAPQGCFAAAAFYMPEPEVLGAIRERIRVHPDKFLALTATLATKNLALEQGETLTRMPKGFEDLANTPIAPALKLKSLLVRRPIPQKLLHTNNLVTAITDLAADALPLLQFGWAAVDEVRP